MGILQVFRQYRNNDRLLREQTDLSIVTPHLPDVKRKCEKTLKRENELNKPGGCKKGIIGEAHIYANHNF